MPMIDPTSLAWEVMWDLISITGPLLMRQISILGINCKVHVNSGLVDYTCTYIQRVKTPKFQCECISCENLFFCYAKIISMYVL